ncbi:hypothetical protein M404DRAFT_34518 [Pisolithus tinctorius Marx 270]|uniref:Uncharacterized protein n=1 Tax=Pisolithus tinctorius Marx 270 TaxID=870435 RepID=A0A0C3JBF1_PISTI|nr:hypothetical protein M404DRAFT_34518 [Pisolithus tinctorius Marx 270]
MSYGLTRCMGSLAWKAENVMEVNLALQHMVDKPIPSQPMHFWPRETGMEVRARQNPLYP